MSTFIYYRSPIEFLHFMHNRPVVKTGKNQENMVKKKHNTETPFYQTFMFLAQ